MNVYEYMCVYMYVGSQMCMSVCVYQSMYAYVYVCMTVCRQSDFLSRQNHDSNPHEIIPISFNMN